MTRESGWSTGIPRVMVRGMPIAWSRAFGSSRADSEDRAEVVVCGDALVVAVADGAGGVSGGAAASDAFAAAVRAKVATQFDPFDIRAWSELFVETDALIARSGGETTAIVVAVAEYGLCGVSVGDSEAWVVANGHADSLTRAQSRVRLGSGRAKPVSFHRRALEGALVVATDGLFKHASARDIARASPMTAERLVELPRLASGAYLDDIAVVVVTRD